MPRKGPAPRRELMPDPIYRSVLVTQIVNKILQRGKRSIAERIVYDALEHHRGEDRRRADRHAQAGRRQRQAPARGQEPPRRWRHLPGARRGPAPPGQHPRHPLDRRLLPAAPREDDGRAPRQRAARRLQRRRRLGQAHARTCTRWPSPTRPSPTTAGRPPPTPAPGRTPPGASLATDRLRSSLGRDRASPDRSTTRPTRTRDRTDGQDAPPRAHPQHRDHGPHRRGQDHDDRADPLLHRQELQDR